MPTIAERVDLARLNREIDAGERDRRAERLSDTAHHQAIAGGGINHRGQQRAVSDEQRVTSNEQADYCVSPAASAPGSTLLVAECLAERDLSQPHRPYSPSLPYSPSFLPARRALSLSADGVMASPPREVTRSSGGSILPTARTASIVSSSGIGFS